MLERWVYPQVTPHHGRLANSYRGQIMDVQTLKQTVVDELALTWLQVPGHVFVLPGFAWTRGVMALEVERVLLEMEREGVVRLQYAAHGGRPAGVVLTPDGQVSWIHGRSATLLLGADEQLLELTVWLPHAGLVSERDIDRRLWVTPLRAHQLVLMLRCLGRVHAAVGVDGRFEGVRWRPAWV